MTHETATAAIREVLIAATDIVPAGSEPGVGWSLVLAERIVDALAKCELCGRLLDDHGICWFHTP
jgi:hypothetical protein